MGFSYDTFSGDTAQELNQLFGGSSSYNDSYENELENKLKRLEDKFDILLDKLS